jgi:hypothetical protein
MSRERVTRRAFIRDAAVLTGGVAAATQSPLAQETPAAPMPRAILGRTGVEVSRLGIGCAHFQRPHVTADDVGAAMHRALELGVDYFDTAPNYGRGDHFAETKMGPTVKEVRDRIFLVTKTEEPSYEGTWQLLRQSMERLQTDRVDLVHVHNFGMETRFEDLDFVFSDKGALGALREAKKQEVIRFIGVSGHHYPSRFHKILDTGEIDVLMNAVNFVCQHVYDFEGKVWSRAQQENLGLVAMKVLGGASGGDQSFRMAKEHYEQAIRYSLSIPGCAVSVIGCENVNEIEQAAQVVANAQPLSTEERMRLAQLGQEMATTPAWRAAYGEPLT